jgi:ABC-2 type transport system permease protein
MTKMTTQTTNYKLTLMQRLLGRNYKWWYLFIYQIKHNTAYRSSTLIWMVGRLLILFTTIFIWWININAGSSLTDFKSIFTYYIFGTIITIGNGIQWNIAGSVKSGSISARLLRPSGIMQQIIISDFGWWFVPSVIEITLLLSIAFIGSQFVIFSSPLYVFLYLSMGVIGYFISVFIAYILGSLAFFIVDVQGVLEIQNQLNFIFSGKALPLNIVSILQPLIFLPFAFTFHHPMQIYLGKYDFNQTLMVFAGGTTWCVVLYFLAKWIFKMGLKKNEAVGL